METFEFVIELLVLVAVGRAAGDWIERRAGLHLPVKVRAWSGVVAAASTGGTSFQLRRHSRRHLRRGSAAAQVRRKLTRPKLRDQFTELELIITRHGESTANGDKHQFSRGCTENKRVARMTERSALTAKVDQLGFWIHGSARCKRIEPR